jgi:hypothetical protein
LTGDEHGDQVVGVGGATAGDTAAAVLAGIVRDLDHAARAEHADTVVAGVVLADK